MTGEIWKEWLRSFDNKMQLQKRKVLLFVDNCPAHSIVPNLKAVTVHFLPPNTTAALQPMDQGVIKCFKSWYRKLLLGKMVDCMDSGMDFKVDVLHGMQFAVKAWDHVSQSCVANCFRHAGWQSGDTSEEDTLPSITEECEALGITDEAMEELTMEEETVQTSEECTDEDIVQYVLASKEPANPCTEEEDESSPPVIPTYQQFLAAMETVQSYTQSLAGTEEVLGLLNKIEKICQEKRKNNLKQSTLDNFINSTELLSPFDCNHYNYFVLHILFYCVIIVFIFHNPVIVNTLI